MSINSFISMFDMPKESLQQRIKWLVYSFLLINFALYIKTDIVVATHTMKHGGTFLEWTRSFATTIDASAWVFLLIIFELETYALSEEQFTRTKAAIMMVIRIICYVFLVHTLYALAVYIYEINTGNVVQDVTNLCQLLGKDISYTANLVYSELDAINCKSLSAAKEFLYIDPPIFIIVTDAEALVVINELAWIDLIEAVTWLLILFSIEALVWLQDKGTITGSFFNGIKLAKLSFYLLLWCMFAWDEFMWIAGFFVIGMNLDQWSDEIKAKTEQYDESKAEQNSKTMNIAR